VKVRRHAKNIMMSLSKLTGRSMFDMKDGVEILIPQRVTELSI